jgi:protein-L-isoaspartate(D-aspartate) O-methyltransferase
MTLPREQFVLPAYRHLAFSDSFMPIGEGQVSLPPKIIGRMLQALKLDPQETVLEVGTGTGYITALLACLVKQVVSVEIIPTLSVKATQLLYSLNLSHRLHSHPIQLAVGNAAQGWQAQAPYDAILFTGSLPFLPADVREQLSVKGRIFAILGREPVMSATLLTRLGKERWSEQVLFETVLPPLIDTPPLKGFQF